MSLLQNPNFNISHYAEDMGWNPYTSIMVSLNPNIHKGTQYDTLWDLIRARTDIDWRYCHLSEHIPLEIVINNLDMGWDYDIIMKRFYLPISIDPILNEQILNNPPKSMEEAWNVVVDNPGAIWRMSPIYIIRHTPLPYAQKMSIYYGITIMLNRLITNPKTVLDAQRALELYRREKRSARFAIPLEISSLDAIQEGNFTNLKHTYSDAELSGYCGLRWSNVVNNPDIKWDFQILSRNPFSARRSKNMKN
jgi:hypothetical protein